MAAESLSFELKLVDAVTAPGKRAADALRNIEMRAKKVSGALDFSKEMGRVESNLKKLSADPRGYVSLIKAQKELKESRNKLLEDAGIKKPETFAQGLMSRFSFAKIAGAAAVGELVAEGAFKVAESLVEGAHMAVEVITDGVKDAFKSVGKEQTQRIGEKITLGAGAGDFREDAERFAKNTPFSSAEIRNFMLPLRRAGLSQAASRQAFSTATDIGGGNPEAVGGILEQFKHIYTKRGIGKKQLVELLGNVGDTIPDFYKALGKEMHISGKEAEKRAEQGGLDPQLLMNMITAAQNKRQGGAAGTGGLEYAKSLETRWKKLNDLPEEFYRKLVDSPGAARASEFLGSLLERLDPEGPAGLRIQAALNDMFEKITGYIGDPRETADALASGIESAIRLTGELISTAKDLADAFLPSLQHIEDMTYALRVLLATGDDNKVAKINNEYANVVEGRGLKLIKKFQEENFNKSDTGKLYDAAGFNPVLQAAQKGGAKEPGHSGDSVKVENHFHGDVSDADEVGRKATDGTLKGVSRGRRHRGG